MLHVVAVITAKPGQRAVILQELNAIVPLVREEEGCIERPGSGPCGFSAAVWGGQFGGNGKMGKQGRAGSASGRAGAAGLHRRDRGRGGRTVRACVEPGLDRPTRVQPALPAIFLGRARLTALLWAAVATLR